MISVLKLVNREIDISPFAVKSKQEPITLGTAGLIAAGSALSSLLGGLFGSSSNKSANETNLEVARMNQQNQRETNAMNKRIADEANALNYKMFNESNAFNLDMWNKNNEYNSPERQVTRMLAAGINPAFGFGNTSEAGSISSAQAAPAQRAEMTAPQLGYHQQPYDPTQAMQGAANAFLEALNWKTNSDVGRSQANYNNVKAQNEQMLGVANLAEAISRTNKNTAEYHTLQQSLALAKRTMEDQVATIHNQALKSEKDVVKTQSEIDVLEVQKRLLAIDEKWKDKLNAASLRATDAGVQQAISAAMLNDAQAVKAAADKAVSDAQAAGLRLDNANKQDMSDAIVQSAYYQADKVRHEAGQARKMYYGGQVGAQLPLPFDKANQGNLRQPDYSHYYRGNR